MRYVPDVKYPLLGCCALLLLTWPHPASGADLLPDTAEAYERYALDVQQRFARQVLDRVRLKEASPVVLARLRAGEIIAEPGHEDGMFNVPGVRFHDGRHTALTRLAEAGQPDWVMQAQMGHVSPAMMKTYSHIRRQAPNAAAAMLAVRGESPSAFDERCILVACVAPPSNTGGILGRRALPARRLARLGAAPDFHHGLLEPTFAFVPAGGKGGEEAVEERLEGVTSQFTPQPERLEGELRKIVKGSGSSGWTRTNNPPVNSRMLCH